MAVDRLPDRGPGSFVSPLIRDPDKKDKRHLGRREGEREGGEREREREGER
jgi:hypothetical protein